VSWQSRPALSNPQPLHSTPTETTSGRLGSLKLRVGGAEDDPAFSRQAQRLHSELRQRYSDPDRVSLTVIPRMGHAFAAEPGLEPAAQTTEAKLVDGAVTGWFRRHLS
jgi:dienelactone hydrolase